MTRKHYVMLAAALARSKPERFHAGAEDAQWRWDCRVIAEALAADNERFDRERFLKACGIE